MSERVDEVAVYRWSDGWRLVRPASDEAFSRLYGRLTHEARQGRTSYTDESFELHRNKRGEGGTVFLVRPLVVPAGARTTSSQLDRGNSVAMAAFFHHPKDAPDGSFVPNVYPGTYRPFVLEGLDRLLGVFLSLGSSVHRVFEDRIEFLTLPRFGSPDLSSKKYVRDFVHHVASVASGTNVATDWDSFGWKPLGGSFPTGLPHRTASIFESTAHLQVSAAYQERHDKGKLRFVVEVDLPPGSWCAVGDEARDVRDFLDEGHPPFLVPDEAPVVPWKVRSVPRGEEAVSTSLTEALVQVGAVARNPGEFLDFVRKKAVFGEMYPNSEVSTLLGLMPELFVCPLGQVAELAAAYGVGSSP